MHRWRIAGINFEHFHMGDNLRMAAALSNVEIVGICDERPERMVAAQRLLGLTAEQVFTDPIECIQRTRPHVVIACPSAAGHGRCAELLLPLGVDLFMEKPFAASLAEADRMIVACQRFGRRLAINWPMAWYPTHLTAYRLIAEGRIGEVRETHYYDGNRGPLWHTAGKEAISAEEVAAAKPTSWFYKKSAGGGSLLDYLGYGTTLGTWFNGGQIPLEVTAVVDQPAGLEVDEHAIVIARYQNGLSKFETRWGTFTDPWTVQPQPKCGFVIVGSEGTVSCFDFEATVRFQSRECPEGTDIPVDSFSNLDLNPVYHFLRHLETQTEFSGTMSLATCRIGQRIVDTAVASAAQGRTLALL